MKPGITRRERQVTDPEEILGILDRGKVVHVGMIDEDRPYVVPMNYGYVMEDGNLILYLHGARTGRKLDVIRRNPNVFIEIDTDIVPFEGELACHYGTTYASVMGEGVAQIIDDIPEKIRGLATLMKTQTGRDFEITEKMVNVVSVIKITVSRYTAKKRPRDA